MRQPIILGCGLAGMLAACTQFQDSIIYETQSKENLRKHTALLRFRSSAVGDALGIDFKKVVVHKGIWYKDTFHQPNPMLCNMYSQKVVDSIQDRSIWNIDTCERWIAPDNFHEQLIDRCLTRIDWKTNFTDYACNPKTPIISTMPMPILAKMLEVGDIPEFKSNKIAVSRWRVKNCNTHQTIYFPDPAYSLYRASIVGDILTAEYACGETYAGSFRVGSGLDLCSAFGISIDDLEPISTCEQQLGKISPIDDSWRKQFMFDATHKHNIYSLGRFATWRQVLLDDVLKDVNVIKKMINSTTYDKALVANGRP